MFDLLTVSIGIGTYWEAVLSMDYCSKLYPLTRRRTLKIKPVDPFHWDCYIAILLYCYIAILLYCYIAILVKIEE